MDSISMISRKEFYKLARGGVTKFQNSNNKSKVKSRFLAFEFMMAFFPIKYGLETILMRKGNCGKQKRVTKMKEPCEDYLGITIWINFDAIFFVSPVMPNRDFEWLVQTSIKSVEKMEDRDKTCNRMTYFFDKKNYRKSNAKNCR